MATKGKAAVAPTLAATRPLGPPLKPSRRMPGSAVGGRTPPSGRGTTPVRGTAAAASVVAASAGSPVAPAPASACESCGTAHDRTYGSGRFCSVHCARRVAAGRKWANQRSAQVRFATLLCSSSSWCIAWRCASRASLHTSTYRRVFDGPVRAWTMHVETTFRRCMAVRKVRVGHDELLRHLRVCLSSLLHRSPPLLPLAPCICSPMPPRQSCHGCLTSLCRRHPLILFISIHVLTEAGR